MSGDESSSRNDVRMRGFAARHTVPEALAWVDAHSSPLADESVPVVEAAGRVLAADVVSEMNVPAFDRSAMDGYAVLACETEGAGDYNPLPFALVGESLPGKPATASAKPGTAVRIMTGAPMPAGYNAVVPAEYARESGTTVEVLQSTTPGKNVGRVGEDIAAGRTVLSLGRRLRPQDLALLASLGVTAVTVARKPAVRILITGNELVPPGQPRGEFQIFEANSAMLAALVAADGGRLESLQRLSDDRAALRDAVAAPGADVVLMSGGSSVGAEDFAPGVVRELGRLDIHGVAMRPSSPAGLGTVGAARVFLLPGNPVSCLCAYDFFAGRAIRQLGGRSGEFRYRKTRAIVDRKIVSAIGRVDYCRVRLVNGRLEPLAVSGAAILSSTVRADGFLIIPAEMEGFPPGTEVEVWLYDEVA